MNKIGVRDLVGFILRSGDLNSAMNSTNTAQAGTKNYSKIGPKTIKLNIISLIIPKLMATNLRLMVVRMVLSYKIQRLKLKKLKLQILNLKIYLKIN